MKNLFLLLIIFILGQSYVPIMAQTTLPDTIVINQITINNPAKIALVKNENNFLIFDNPDYQIVYMPDSKNEFLVDIKNDNFNKFRLDAQSKLLEILGTTESDVCWLYVVITSTNRGDTTHWGKNFEPSFCFRHQSRRLRDNSTDVNIDDTTNILDYALVLINYGKSNVDISEDVNGDNMINSRDLSLVLKN